MGLFTKEKAFLTIDRSGVRVRLENGKTERFLPNEIQNISVSEDGPTVYLATTKGTRVYATTMSYKYLQECAQHALDKGPVQKSNPEEKLVSMLNPVDEESGVVDVSQQSSTSPSTSAFMVDGQPIVMHMNSQEYPTSDTLESALENGATPMKTNAFANLIVILFVIGFFILPMFLSFASILVSTGNSWQQSASQYNQTPVVNVDVNWDNQGPAPQDVTTDTTVPPNYSDPGIYLIPQDQTPWATTYALEKGNNLILRINDIVKIVPNNSDANTFVEIQLVGVGSDSATPEYPNGVPRAYFNFLPSNEPAFSSSFNVGQDLNEVLTAFPNFSIAVTSVADGYALVDQTVMLHYN